MVQNTLKVQWKGKKSLKETPKGTDIKALLGPTHGTPLQYFCLENSMDGGAW